MCCSEVFVICCCYYLRLHYHLLPSVALVVLLCLLDEMNETNEGGGVKKVQTNTFRLHYLRLHYLRLHYLRPHYLLLPSVALVVLLCVLDEMNETNEGGGVKKVQTNIFRLHYLRLHYLRLHYLRPHYLLLPSIALVVLLCVLDKMNETNEGGGVKKRVSVALVVLHCLLDEMNEINEGGGVKKVLIFTIHG